MALGVISVALLKVLTSVTSHSVLMTFVKSSRKWCNPHMTITGYFHYGDVIMMEMPYQITSLTIVYSTVYSGTDERKHQSSTSLAFVRGIHRSPVNSPHKGPVTLKMFPFDGVIMLSLPKQCTLDICHFPHNIFVTFLKICYKRCLIFCL